MRLLKTLFTPPILTSVLSFVISVTSYSFVTFSFDANS